MLGFPLLNFNRQIIAFERCPLYTFYALKHQSTLSFHRFASQTSKDGAFTCLSDESLLTLRRRGHVEVSMAGVFFSGLIWYSVSTIDRLLRYLAQ